MDGPLTIDGTVHMKVRWSVDYGGEENRLPISFGGTCSGSYILDAARQTLRKRDTLCRYIVYSFLWSQRAPVYIELVIYNTVKQHPIHALWHAPRVLLPIILLFGTREADHWQQRTELRDSGGDYVSTSRRSTSSIDYWYTCSPYFLIRRTLGGMDRRDLTPTTNETALREPFMLPLGAKALGNSTAQDVVQRVAASKFESIS